MTARRAGRIAAAGAAALLLLGAALRGWHLFADPLWLDEAYSAYAAGHGFGFLWRVVPLYETHPPFYYSLLRLWELAFGDSLPALRLLGFAAGLLTLPALGWSAIEAGRILAWSRTRRVGLAFATLALGSVQVALVEMAREVRPYPLMILVYALATANLLRIARRWAETGRAAPRPIALHLLLVALMLWLHNLGPLWAVAMTLALLAAIDVRRLSCAEWVWLASGHLLVGIAYVPALLILLDQAPTWIASTWLHVPPATLWTHLSILYAVPGWAGATAGVLAVLALIRLGREGPHGRRLATMLLALALVPVALSLAITFSVAPVFITRTMTPVAAPVLLLLAIGASGCGGRAGRLGAAAGTVLFANMLAVEVQARRGGPMQDWYGTIAWLQRRFRPGDLILAYPNEAALPMQRALRDKGLTWPVQPIPAPVPVFGDGGRSGWHPTGSRGVVSLPRETLRTIAGERTIRTVGTIWLLRLGAETYDQGDVATQEFLRGRHRIRRWRDGFIDVIGLRQGPAPGR